MQKAAFGDSIGAMTIAGGIAAGLLQKERTGEGPVVDISLLGTAMWVLGPDIVSSKLLEGRQRRRHPVVQPQVQLQPAGQPVPDQGRALAAAQHAPGRPVLARGVRATSAGRT